MGLKAAKVPGTRAQARGLQGWRQALAIIDEIRSYITTTYLDDAEAAPGDDDALFDEGVLDSIHIVTLMLFLQERFNIEITPADINPASFRSLSTVAALVASKQGAAG